MGILAKTTESRLNWLAPALTSLLCLSPIVLLWHRFRTLYWFHDDWDLISEMQSLSPLDWLTKPYGENFVPLFKAMWAGAIILVHGNYFGMIWVLWITHLAILLLLAAVLRQCGFDWKSQSLAVVTLGLPWSNIESLGWAACWISPLSVIFFLLAWVFVLSFQSKRGSSWFPLLAAVSALASAMTFSRGILTGGLLAFFILRATSTGECVDRRNRWLAACLASITMLSLIPYGWTMRGHPNLQGWSTAKLAAIASYGLHYFLLSPLFHLLPMSRKEVDLRSLVIAGTCKVLIVGAGLLLSRGRQRVLLWTLLLLDIGMAGLVGVGRYDRGIATAVSYRYQYVSLLCFAPFFAIVAMRGLQLFDRPKARNVAFAVIFAGWALLLGYPWVRHIERWSQWRGTDVRNALASTPPDQRFGLANITAGRAKELINIYGLH